MRGKEDRVPRARWDSVGSDPRRRHLLLVVKLAVELLVPVEAGGLQGLFAGGALHALLMPEAVVEPQQKPIGDDPLTALADFGLTALPTAAIDVHRWAALAQHPPQTQPAPPQIHHSTLTDYPTPESPPLNIQAEIGRAQQTKPNSVSDKQGLRGKVLNSTKGGGRNQ